MKSDEKRICKKCLLRDRAKTDRENVEKYLQKIAKEDKAPADIYEKRLACCQTCDKLVEATCDACGCYVEFRAAVRHEKCPYKKWD